MENNCHYLSSYGILKSCTHYYNLDESKIFDETNIKYGDSIFVKIAFLTNFIESCLINLKVPIVLVSGNGDWYISDTIFSTDTNAERILNYRVILDSPIILKWFTINCFISDVKIVNLPYGLDYHTLSKNAYLWWGEKLTPIQQENNLLEIVKSSVHFTKRNKPIYGCFHFFPNRGDRIEAIKNIQPNLIYYEPNPVLREIIWKNQTEFAFVASPYGNGPDCIRTWEALILGCIPIVKKSLMTPLYKDLPVLIVDNWSDITLELLNTTIAHFSQMTFNYDKLSLSYWVREIKEAGKFGTI